MPRQLMVPFLRRRATCDPVPTLEHQAGHRERHPSGDVLCGLPRATGHDRQRQVGRIRDHGKLRRPGLQVCQKTAGSSQLGRSNPMPVTTTSRPIRNHRIHAPGNQVPDAQARVGDLVCARCSFRAVSALRAAGTPSQPETRPQQLPARGHRLTARLPGTREACGLVHTIWKLRCQPWSTRLKQRSFVWFVGSLSCVCSVTS